MKERNKTAGGSWKKGFPVILILMSYYIYSIMPQNEAIVNKSSFQIPGMKKSRKELTFCLFFGIMNLYHRVL